MWVRVPSSTLQSEMEVTVMKNRNEEIIKEASEFKAVRRGCSRLCLQCGESVCPKMPRKNKSERK